MPQIKEIVQNKDGASDFIMEDGDELLTGAIKSLGDRYVEVFSEKSGGAFDIAGKIIGKAVPPKLRGQITKAFLFGRWMEKNPGAKATGFGKFLKEAGWNGFLNEV